MHDVEGVFWHFSGRIFTLVALSGPLFNSQLEKCGKETCFYLFL